MDTFIARQPIFDKQQQVYAYELLFRSGLTNACQHPDLNEAASKVIADSGLLLGTENLTGGKKAFINVTREVLVNELVHLLPKELTVVELLETVEPDAEVVSACQKLKQSGYLLALDDFVYDARFEPLIELADIIKVDFLATGRTEQEALARRMAATRTLLLAEKIETHEAFQEAANLGFSFFQGYFFCKPTILANKDIPGFKLNYLRMLQEINRPDLNFQQIEQIIRRDLALTYKLLRYINSAAFSWRSEIDSIRQALMMLGERQFKKWVSLVVLTSMAQDKAEELVVQAVVRARFGEALAPFFALTARADDLFLMGLFSLIDAILDRPLSDVLKDLPLADDIKAALTGQENVLRQAHQFILAYEQGDWATASACTEQFAMDESVIPKLYLAAVEWAAQGMQENRRAGSA
jgi:c-di-GMP-related signal transduction protein